MDADARAKGMPGSLGRSPGAGRGVAVSLYLRALAAVYLVAFGSLWVQVDGLVGERGILPARDLVERLRDAGLERWLRVPTLFHLSATDAAFHAACGAGAAIAALAIAAPFWTAPWILLWALYLSLANVCGDFLRFQWDSLLLEAGFLAVFLAPPRLLPSARPLSEPTRLIVWLQAWLAFRLLFASGVVKLTHEDPTWLDLTALSYHYETQPLPPWTAWYVHGLPMWFHRASAIGMYAIEIAVPFLFFGPPRLRRIACALSLLLQLVIAATGNYGFFNALTAALLIPILDDGTWPRRLRSSPYFAPPVADRPATWRRRWPWQALCPLAAVLVVVGAWLLAASTLRIELPRWMDPIGRLYSAVARFHIVNEYGLFRTMTTERPEIIIEGTLDGAEWRPYEFRYKPGDVTRAPAFVAPYQPRLDWQMWFAALSPRRAAHWLEPFCLRLLEASPPVLGLLARDPFDGRPPLRVRALLYDYELTSRGPPAGGWWRRKLLGELIRPVGLESFRRH